MNQYGTSYKRGSLFFPKILREKVYVVYAFVRAVDQLVDTPWVDTQIAREHLLSMLAKTQQAWHWTPISDELITEFIYVAKEFHFERERIESFFEAMRMDTYIDRYTTYEQLQTYMYGSAEVIGLMMTQLIGYQEDKERVFSYAKQLGEAMQYTNFLRDVREDRLDHGRLYMPWDRLTQFWLSHQDVISFVEQWRADDRWQGFCHQEIVFTQKLYTASKTWIALLDRQWQFAVLLSATLYEGILWKIKKVEYDQFAHDAHTTKREKVMLFLQLMLSWK